MHAAGGRHTQPPDPLGDGPTEPPAATHRLLGVSEVHDLIRAALRDAGLENVWVSGVVSGLRTGPKFTSWELVEYQGDATTVRSMLHVGAFAREYTAITRVLANAGVTLADGLEVSFYGRLEPAAAFGRLRLLAHDVDARVAVGAAALRRQQLLEDLQASGELTAQRSLAPPADIRRLGLLSAAAAAGRADVLSVLSRSPSPIDIVEASAALSGPTAPGQVAQALGRLQAAHVDAIIIARGGGARSDLAAWDSATVAHAIARCPIPVLTALGHATDHTVADLVAHGAHETPSAAAGMIVARSEAIAGQQRAAAAHHGYQQQMVNAQHEAAAERHAHQLQLARARRRAAWATAIALVALLLLILVLT